MIPALRTAIYQLGKAVVTAWYFVQAKQTETFPFGVFFPIAAPDNYDTGRTEYTQTVFQTSLFSSRLNEIETLDANLQSEFKNPDNWSVFGYDLVGVFKQNSITTKEDKVWAINTQYQIELQKQ